MQDTCTLPCTANPSEACGGSNYMGIYGLASFDEFGPKYSHHRHNHGHGINLHSYHNGIRIDHLCSHSVGININDILFGLCHIIRDLEGLPSNRDLEGLNSHCDFDSLSSN